MGRSATVESGAFVSTLLVGAYSGCNSVAEVSSRERGGSAEPE
jgi:hypothetical protein